MSNDRRISAAILTKAAELTGKVRGPQHGAIEESFDMIGEMWSVYVNNAIQRATGIEPNPRVHIRGIDVLRMMGQLKQARSLWGDENNADNYIDEAGYAGLAATYAGVGATEFEFGDKTYHKGQPKPEKNTATIDPNEQLESLVDTIQETLKGTK